MRIADALGDKLGRCAIVDGQLAHLSDRIPRNVIRDRSVRIEDDDFLLIHDETLQRYAAARAKRCTMPGHAPTGHALRTYTGHLA